MLFPTLLKQINNTETLMSFKPPILHIHVSSKQTELSLGCLSCLRILLGDMGDQMFRVVQLKSKRRYTVRYYICHCYINLRLNCNVALRTMWGRQITQNTNHFNHWSPHLRQKVWLRQWMGTPSCAHCRV